MPVLLITPEEFITYRDVSTKLNEARINECIKLAQESDLHNALNDFYFDVLANYQDIEYGDLMNGSTFIYDGESFTHDGIKIYLGDLTYARFMSQANMMLTAFGAVSKISDNSEPISSALIKSLSNQSQLDASNKFKTIDLYLRANDSIFPRYLKCNTTTAGTGYHSTKFWTL